MAGATMKRDDSLYEAGRRGNYARNGKGLQKEGYKVFLYEEFLFMLFLLRRQVHGFKKNIQYEIKRQLFLGESQNS